MHHHRSVFLFSLCVTATCVAAQGEVDNRSTAKKGASVRLINDLTTDATVELQGREVATSQTTSRTLHLQVKDVDADGNYLIETRIVRVQGKFVMPEGQGEFAFDSGDDSVPAAGMKNEMTAGAGMTFQVKLSPTGRLLALGEGADALLTASKGARASMHVLNRASLGQMVTDAFGILPEKKTAGGAQWRLEGLRTVGKAPLLAKVQATLSKVDLDTFEIEGTGTVELAMDQVGKDEGMTADETAEVQRQIKSAKVNNGKVTRKQVTSRTDGFVASASETVEMDMEVGESAVGAMSSHIKMGNNWRRTTEADAMPKKAAEANAEKKTAEPRKQ